MNLLNIENIAATVTFWAALVAFVLFIFHLAMRKDFLKHGGMAGMAIALFGAGTTLTCRGLIAQHAPWSNLWESMITLMFVSLVFYFIVEWWYKPRFFGVLASPLVLIMIGGASILPPHFKGAAPLMPALQSYWIKVHVLLVLCSYAAFTMSFAAAVTWLYFDWRNKQAALAGAVSVTPVGGSSEVLPLPGGAAAMTLTPALVGVGTPAAAGLSGAALGSPEARNGRGADGGPFADQLAFFDELTYRLILAGFPLLMIGIITGAMWANGAWGTYWSWDPKETWSLITWFIYAAYLHARLSLDWSGRKTAGLACVGFVSVIVTYIGVNYLSSGLHSYGFLR